MRARVLCSCVRFFVVGNVLTAAAWAAPVMTLECCGRITGRLPGHGQARRGRAAHLPGWEGCDRTSRARHDASMFVRRRERAARRRRPVD